MATSYHQLGTLAHERGDYAEAERLYRGSLTIFEELGNRAGMAGSRSALGRLAATAGQPAQAISSHIRALALRVEFELPEAERSIAALAELREQCGRAEFQAEAAKTLSPNETAGLDELLDRYQRPDT